MGSLLFFRILASWRPNFPIKTEELLLQKLTEQVRWLRNWHPQEFEQQLWHLIEGSITHSKWDSPFRITST